MYLLIGCFLYCEALNIIGVEDVEVVLSIMTQLDVAYVTDDSDSKESSDRLFFVPSRLTSDDLNIKSSFPPPNLFVDKETGESQLFVCARFTGAGEGNTILPSFIGRIAYTLSHHSQPNRVNQPNQLIYRNIKDATIMMSRGQLYIKLPNQTECVFKQEWNKLDVLIICKNASDAPSDVLYFLQNVCDLLRGSSGIWREVHFLSHQLCGGCMGKIHHKGSVIGKLDIRYLLQWFPFIHYVLYMYAVILQMRTMSEICL